MGAPVRVVRAIWMATILCYRCDATRMREIPKVEVHIVQLSDPPTGTDEPDLPPVAPAIRYTIAAAAGKRLHSLPLGPATFAG
jgi:isoquinoline 1-oxidoreductase beta subunit